LPVPVRAELRKIAKNPNCSILSWFERSGNDTQTFLPSLRDIAMGVKQLEKRRG